MSIHISCKDVSVAYARDGQVEYALRDFTVAIPRGQWVAVVGTNGSGKSTLGRVLSGLCPISRGDVVISPSDQGHSKVGLVFQDPNAQIVGQTVSEDIAFGLENIGTPPHDIPNRVAAALSAVGLRVSPDTPVETLSGGQKQLLCVAATLAMRPTGIVFDEVTAMQSPRIRLALLQVAKRLRDEGVTVLWVTQWLDELAYADRVIALDRGHKVYDGPVRAFFERMHGQPSACELLGFSRPFVVEVADELRNAGMELTDLPLTPEALAKAVMAR
ncbi:ATP-binding cassette domain-containing protein [Alicyclobacillus pomorum]|uniref:ATP-binding cassette domain-containing protein n=1 Tax=Alicyclobacillus pomorum TaxID=204470 RepID=UPI00041D6511|nr:ATP-binding cassette domain-containing protein [Alicyclobacillus pomorum]